MEVREQHENHVTHAKGAVVWDDAAHTDRRAHMEQLARPTVEEPATEETRLRSEDAGDA